MKILKREAWVTSAISAEEARNALVLCFSLRTTLTTRKLLVIASPTLSKELRDALQYAFDQVHFLEEDRKPECLTLADFAKLSTIGICHEFGKYIYLLPNSVAINNADELFDYDILHDAGDRLLNLTNFMMKPSLKEYKMFLSELHQRGKTDQNSLVLRPWLIERFTELVPIPLCGSFDGAAAQNYLLKSDLEITIVNLPQDAGMAFRNNSLGLLEQEATSRWMNIFRRHIEPMLKNPACSVFSKIPRQCNGNEPIAVVGMSGKLPKSENIHQFWNLLLSGEDGTGHPPSFRWKKNECSKSFPDGKTNVGFLPYPVDEFDAKFFGISPKEAAFMDPQHRILLEVVWEALEDACINPFSLSETAGSVFLGSWAHDYQHILEHSGNDEYMRVYFGNAIDAATARISNCLKLTGPAVATEGACAGSMVAVHLACNALRLGHTNIALAAGVNLLVNPFSNGWMPMVTSEEGHCKTFCEKADGFARAEGCCALVLKRLSDAVRDGDNIWALIKGTGTSQEGTSSSFGTPTIMGESLAMTRALHDAGVNPEDVSFVETHGTGTPVGDPVEIAAIAKAYHSKQRKEPLIIGSVKTNVGHTESCSGITGIIKTILAMHYGVIPPHINFGSLNPAIDLEAIPATIALRAMEWPTSCSMPKRAGVSSFGLSGINAHVILEEPPQPTCEQYFAQFERPTCILKVSAKSSEALEDLISRTQESVTADNSSSLQDICYSGNVGRADFNFRAVITARSKKELVYKIQHNNYMKGEVSSNRGKVCFLFTGQGSQYPGMAKQLYETCPTFRIHFDYYEGILRSACNIDIKRVLWDKDSTVDLNRTLYSQTSIFVVECALLKLLESWGVRPDYALGHSLGEFAAAVCAGILRVEDAIMLIAERIILVDKLPEGKMLVIRADKEQVASLLQAYFKETKGYSQLEIAAVNSSEQTVVAGDSADVLGFSGFCKNNNFKCTLLGATHAFHSRHMDPILNAFSDATAKIKCQLQTCSCEFISAMSGTLLEKSEVNREYWIKQARNAVLFLNASKEAFRLGCRIFIEVGPQPILCNLIAMNSKDTDALCLPLLKKSEEDWTCLLQTLGALYLQGIQLNWNGLDNFYSRKKVRSLPHYPFQRKKVWAEKLIDSAVSIHPLLGSPFKNATSTKLFQSFIKLASHKYLQDHVVGKHIIFPMCGYLEMCLKAGIDTASMSDSSLNAFHPVKVENLRMKVPLQLTDSKRTQLQTVMDTGKLLTESASDLPIRIFERIYAESQSTWHLQADATFSQAPTLSDISVPTDMLTQLQNFGKCEGSTELAHQFYEYLASTGLEYGSSFRSMQKIWVGEDGKSNLAKIRIPAQTRNQYLLHPVAMDAMVQTYYLSQFIRNEKFKLLLPIKIGRFVWFGNESPVEECLLYAYADSADYGGDSCTTLLLTKDGKVIAKMSGVECAQTTLKQVEGMLEKKLNLAPGRWEEVWRPSVGHLQHRIDMDLYNGCHSYEESFVREMWKKFGCPDERAVATFRSLAELAYYNILRALYGCGLRLPGIGCSISRKSVVESLQLQAGFQGLIGSYLEILVEEGILKRDLNEEDRYIVIRTAPVLEQVVEILCSKELSADLANKFCSTSLLLELGTYLSDILKNGKSALPILFPEGENQYVPMETFYREYNGLFGLPDLISDVLLKWLENVQASQMKDPHSKVVLRILEIGGGTGSFTVCLIRVLDKLGIHFEYTFTDVSSAFFAAAQTRFKKWAKSIRFVKFNIEEDPLKQGLIPEYFDYICGENVVHATKNIRTSLSNVALLLRLGGRLDLVETTERSTIITYLFGVLDGFWRFDDTDLRPKHCLIPVDKWKWALEQEGLEMVAEFPAAKISNLSFICSRKTVVPTSKLLNEPSSVSSVPLWLLFHQQDHPISNFLLKNFPAKTRRQLIVVTSGETFSILGDCITTRIKLEKDFSKLLRSIVESGNFLEGILYCWTLNGEASSQEEILQPYFYLAKALLELGLQTGTRLLSLFSGVAAVEGHSFGNIHQSTIWGFARSLSSEHPDLDCRCIDIGNSNSTTMEMLQVFHEIWNLPEKKGPTHIAYGGNVRYTPKLQPFRDHPRNLEIPPITSRFRLQLPSTRAIEDLQIVPLEDCGVGENEVEVQVKVTALNFKDVLVVLQATQELQNEGVGLDIAGVIKRVGSKVTKWSVGDSVFCCNPNSSPLHSHAVLHENDVFAMDSKMSWADAATLPVAFLTTYLGLVEVAKIRSRDNVLIHTASGGVGLCALQLCNMVGANVICTAGSNRKRNYLRSLGIQHIFDSRKANYGEKILEVTGGRGVDVVLNSLTSEGFKEETLMCCAVGARFVEMSKLNVWTSDELTELRPDVDYTIIDVLQIKSSHRQKILKALTELLMEGKISPLPYVQFDLVNIREALKYLQQGKHIGKIVCIMPELRHVNGENTMDAQIFHDKGTYLITGGRVGGIGFAVCKWMVEKGAKYILLAARSFPTEKAQKEISQLNSEYSAKVTPVQLDIGEYWHCIKVLENGITEMGYPPLRGVMHCAGALNDGLVQNQDWEGLSMPLCAKVEGTLNLHKLTKDKNLEHFVIFSSIVGLLGPSGQSNHCAANNFEDVFAHYRHSLGLPVTTINWGHWADVGVGTEIEIPGLKQFSEKQGIAGLEFALKSHRTQIAICNFDLLPLPHLLVRVPHAATYLDEKIWKQRSDADVSSHSSSATPTASDDFWRDMDSADSSTLKLGIVKTNITKILKNILKLDESEVIGEDQNFQDIGVDSLMYLEIGNAVKTLLGRRASVKTSTLREFHSISALSEAVLGIIIC